MKISYLTLINIFLFCFIAMACIAHPLEMCNETSAPNSSVCSISDTLENRDNDSDQDFEIHTYKTRPTPVRSAAINNSMFMPVLVSFIFTPPQFLS